MSADKARCSWFETFWCINYLIIEVLPNYRRIGINCNWLKIDKTYLLARVVSMSMNGETLNLYLVSGALRVGNFHVVPLKER